MTWNDLSSGARTGAQFEDAIIEQATHSRVFDVEKAPYNAIPDDFFLDGVSNATTTFTSATANFTSSDTGAYIVILKGGASGQQDHHATITYVNSTTVTLQSATGRSQTSCRFYLSRNGNQGAAIQAAMDAAHDVGGGIVHLPGVGYFTTQTIVMKNRCALTGAGRRATMLHLGPNVNAPVVRNDMTLNNASHANRIENIWIEGNRGRQVEPTTTLTAAYTAGDATISVASAAAFDLPVGTIMIGTNFLEYTAVSGTTITIGGGSGFGGGLYGSTDANASNGATVTILKAHGIMFSPNPTTSGGTIEEQYDPHHVIHNVFVKNVGSYGVALWGVSAVVVDKVWCRDCWYVGFRSSWDTVFSNCLADTGGRIGFYFRGSAATAVNCRAYYNGGVVAAQGWGYLLEGPTIQEEGCRTLAACFAQDNKAEGFYLRLAQRVQIQGGASSNGTSSVGTYAAMKIEGSTLGHIDLVCTERVASPNNSQQNALYIIDTPGGFPVGQCQVRVSHGAATGSAVGTAIKSGSQIGSGINLLVNGMGGTLAGTYAASYTPDPYMATTHSITLTGNITVNAPTNAHYGCPLRLVLTQDATGGRTMTFNAALPNTWGPSLAPNAVNVIEWYYNGTAWVQIVPDPAAPISKRTLADVSDAVIATNTALTDLDFAVAANTDYTFVYYLPFTSAATTCGVAFGVSAPASPTTFGYQVTTPFAADGAGGTWQGSGTSNNDNVISTGVIATATVYVARIEGILRTGATAGTLTVSFTPETAQSVTVRRGAQGILYTS